jgi:hypothetical protein
VCRLSHSLSLTLSRFHTISHLQKLKLDTLCDLYETLATTQTVIFANTPRTVRPPAVPLCRLSPSRAVQVHLMQRLEHSRGVIAGVWCSGSGGRLTAHLPAFPT